MSAFGTWGTHAEGTRRSGDDPIPHLRSPIFHSRCGVTEYLRLHHGVDICLDPFPFTGATTTCHAMWMGVPTLPLLGATVPGRLGPAMLAHVGLETFIAGNQEDFVDKGVRWAQNLSALSELRACLRERLRASTLCQATVVAEAFAASLRKMWKSWCVTHGRK
jgi:protein O-GlcNAc transferase